MNAVSITGRITKDLELKTTSNGKSFTYFDIAVQRSYKSNDGETLTDFINCVAWGSTAEFICKYFVKGKPIEILGRIETRGYKDKNDNLVKVTEIVCEKVNFTLSDNSNTKDTNVNAKEEKVATKSADDDFILGDDEELPF